jgi:hypothetical protein
MQGNSFVRIYDSNMPLTTGYVMGLSNNAFMLMKSAQPSATNIGIGTATPLAGSTLHVHGTIATSNIVPYPPNNTLYFGNATLAGINNLAISGNITVNGTPFGSGQWDAEVSDIITQCNVGIGTTNPFAKLHVHGTTIISSNVGIGTTIAPSNLTVQGDALVNGVLTVGRLVDQSARTGSYNAWSLYPSGGPSKTVLTNDATPLNRVLFTFTLKPGYYLINGNIPYINLTSFVSIDTINWATIGLYASTPAAYSDALTPLYTSPLVAIGGASTDFDTCSFNTFIVTEVETTYVIAVSGRGHQLQFGGTGLPTPVVHTIPTRGIGMNDNINVTRAIQINPIRQSFITTPNQSSFVFSSPGVFNVHGSNVDLYINGIKYVYRTDATSDFTISSSSVDSVNTTYTINTSTPLAGGNAVEIAIWPTAISTDYFSSGYFYQSVNQYSHKWLNVAGGGMRAAERLVVDGDLFVGGNIHFGCNTTTFESGALWSGDATSITSNIIGSANVVDGAITTPKLVDGAVTNAKIADGTISTAKFATGAVTTTALGDNSVTASKLALATGNVGIGTTVARTRLDVGGTVMSTTGFAVNCSNVNLSYDLHETSFGTAPTVSFQTSNEAIQVPALVRLEAKDAPWSGWFSCNEIKIETDKGYLNGSAVTIESTNGSLCNVSSIVSTGTSGITAFVLAQNSIDTGFGHNMFKLTSLTPQCTISLGNGISSSSTLELTYRINSVTQVVQTSNIMISDEWAVYAVTIPPLVGSYINVYKNGRLIATQLNTQAITQSITFNRNTLAELPINASRASIGGFMLFDSVLAAEQLTTVTSYFMRGMTCLRTPAPLLQTNPLSYMTTGDYAMGAAQNMDINANLRVHSLPSDSVWSFDPYSPLNTFANADASSLPTFTTIGGSFGVVFSPNRFLQFAPTYMKCGSQGLTYIMRFRGLNHDGNTSFLFIGQDVTLASGTYVNLSTSSNKLRLTVRNGASVISTDSVTEVPFTNGRNILTVAVRIDPALNGRASIWINGVKDVETGATPALASLQDQLFQNIFINRTSTSTGSYTILGAALYNRALTDTEIRQAHMVMSTDTPYASTEVGSRSGRTSIAVSKEGYIAPFTMSPDNIPGMIAYLPLDNHLFDATSGINWLRPPQITGNVQFNNKGRVGSSLVLTNPVNGIAANFVTYPFNSPLDPSKGITISAWIKQYIPGSAFLSVSGDFSDSIGINFALNGTNDLRVRLQQTSGDSTNIYFSPYYDGGSNVFTVNTWNHVALTMSSSSSVLYGNGLASTVQGGVASYFLRSLVLGGRVSNPTNVSQALYGEIDDVRIYNRVLSADEVRTLAAVQQSVPSMSFNSAGTGNSLMSVNTGGVQVAGPLQLSATTTIDSMVTNTSNMSSIVNVSAQGYQFSDLTGLQSNIVFPNGVSITNVGPFSYEGSIQLQNGWFSLNSSSYNFNWWQNGGFTLELWVNYGSFSGAAHSSPAIPTLIGLSIPNVQTTYWSFGANNSGFLTFMYWNGTSIVSVTSSTPTQIVVNTWNHIAVSCDTTTIRLYLNGKLEHSVALQSITGVTIAAGTPILFGSTTMSSVTTIISNALIAGVRLVRGTALYNATTLPSIGGIPGLSATGTNVMLLRNSLNHQTPMSLTSTGNMTLAGNISAGNLGMFRNRIINGDMRIDQRNNGVQRTGVTSTQFIADRTKFEVFQLGTYSIQRIASDVPPGFTHSIQVTVSATATTTGTFKYAMLTQRIEGNNIADFNFGTQYASPIVVSFWVKSSVTGTYGLALDNNHTGGRGYTTTFRIDTANTWERKVAYIPGDTSGTWNSTNDVGMRVCISLGNSSDYNNTLGNDRWTANSDRVSTTGNVNLSATNGATFLMTGLQVEKGTLVTPFEYRPFAIELQLCQMYCMRFNSGTGLVPRFCIGMVVSSGSARFVLPYPITMRTSLTNHSAQFSTSGIFGIGLGAGTPTLTSYSDSTPNALALDSSGMSGLTIGQAVLLSGDASAWIQVDVEL